MKGQASKYPSIFNKIPSIHDHNYRCKQPPPQAHNSTNMKEVYRIYGSDKSRYQISKTSRITSKRDTAEKIFEQDNHCPFPEVGNYHSQSQSFKKKNMINPELSFIDDRYRMKPAQLIGHFYSPRSSSMVQQVLAKKCQVKQTNKSRVSDTRVRFRDKISILNKQDKQIQKDSNKVKIGTKTSRQTARKRKSSFKKQKEKIDPSLLKQIGTQSRMTQFGEEVNQNLKDIPFEPLQWKGYIMLINRLQNGFIHSQLNEKIQEKDLQFLQYQDKINEDHNPDNFFHLEGAINDSVAQISLSTPLSQLKILLIESLKCKVSFHFASSFLDSIDQQVSHSKLQSAFKKVFAELTLQIKGHLLNFKKFTNCVLATINLPESQQKPGKYDKAAILWYYTGHFYIGKWKSGKDHNEGFKSGIGLQFYPKGFIYYGSFQYNMRHGYGIMKKANKQIYLGQWLCDKRQGRGKLFDSKGSLIHDGYFEKGRFKQSKIKSDVI